MLITIGGARGGRPVHEAPFSVYGGATSSILIEQDDTRVIIDAGTGIWRLVEKVGSPSEHGERVLTLLLTHLHHDHVMGLAAAMDLARRGWRVDVKVPRIAESASLHARHLLREPLWPAPLPDGLDFSVLPHVGPIRIGCLEISWVHVNHPGGCAAYRVQSADAAVAYVTDFEWRLSSRVEARDLEALCREPRPVDTLLCDGQDTCEESVARRGWGHSTVEDALDLAQKARVSALVVVHHDPARSDAVLNQVDTKMRHQLNGPRFAMGKEGDTWDPSGPLPEAPLTERLSNGYADKQHLMWLAERYHELTVLADAKAGFVIALSGALAGATLEGLSSRGGNGLQLAVVIVYLSATAVTMTEAFFALRPRTRTSTTCSSTPVFFFGDVAKCESDPRQWLDDMRASDPNLLLAGFAANVSAMATIVQRKLNDVKLAIRWFLATGAVWILLVLQAFTLHSGAKERESSGDHALQGAAGRPSDAALKVDMCDSTGVARAAEQ